MKQKGFTLIELLAVIVVLAVIAMIAVPTVLNIIERARSGAAKSSAMSYVKAVETYIVTSKLDNKMEQLQAGETYTTDKLNNLVELKGTKPTNGNVIISNKNSVANATLIINGYTITYNGEDDSYKVEGKEDNNNSNSGSTGGLLANITFKEKHLAVGFPTTTTELKKAIDKVLDNIITFNENEIDITELTALKNATYTWSSDNTDIIDISETNVTGKKEGTATVSAKTNKGQEFRIPFKVAKGEYLSDVAQVGDYVMYDAGVWTSSADKSTTHGNFGGYTSGQNKANSVEWCYQEKYTTQLKGWRVLSVDKSTNTVTLVHAGHPECYYHGTNSADSVNKLNARATSEYLNTTYAESVHMMNKAEADLNILRTTGDYYWLAVAYSTSLYSVSNAGGISALTDLSFGVRPVVVLKSGIRTTGKGTDVVGQEAWNLVTP